MGQIWAQDGLRVSGLPTDNTVCCGPADPAAWQTHLSAVLGGAALLASPAFGA